MKRREILKYTAYATGAALAAPLTSAILSGCTAEPTAPGFVPAVFSAEDFQDLSAMLETMLPETDTPGAISLGIPAFVDKVLATYSEEKTQLKIKKGLARWRARTAEAEGKVFAKLEGDRQLTLLNELDVDSKAAQAEVDAADEGMTNDEKEEKEPWWLALKSIAIGGYYSSEHIGLEVLNYNQVPGPYQGCVPLAEVGKQWSLS